MSVTQQINLISQCSQVNVHFTKFFIFSTTEILRITIFLHIFLLYKNNVLLLRACAKHSFFLSLYCLSLFYFLITPLVSSNFSCITKNKYIMHKDQDQFYNNASHQVIHCMYLYVRIVIFYSQVDKIGQSNHFTNRGCFV